MAAEYGELPLGWYDSGPVRLVWNTLENGENASDDGGAELGLVETVSWLALMGVMEYPAPV